jgi:hypothetical protein
VLAPVLARLDSIPGIAPARVDSSGRYFWLAPGGGVDPGIAAARAREILGEGARVLPPDEAEAQLVARGRGDPWLSAQQVMTLSFVEGRLLSVRISAAAAREIGLGSPGTEAVAEAIRVELFATLERVHAEGGRGTGAWIDAAWPAIAAAAAARCATLLPPDQHRRLAGRLPALLRS